MHNYYEAVCASLHNRLVTQMGAIHPTRLERKQA